MIRILETRLTAKMSLPEARALHKLLSKLPSKRNDIRVNAAEFTPSDWEHLNAMYQAFEVEVGESAKAL